MGDGLGKIVSKSEVGKGGGEGGDRRVELHPERQVGERWGERGYALLEGMPKGEVSDSGWERIHFL